VLKNRVKLHAVGLHGERQGVSAPALYPVQYLDQAQKKKVGKFDITVAVFT
jgi:hypothetical protein